MGCTWLTSRGGDGGDVGSSGVILETEARLEATGKELVRDRDPSDGVQRENFRPRRSATVGRVDLDFCKHFVEGCESLGLFLEEPPNPVLEYGVRGFAVAGISLESHESRIIRCRSFWTSVKCSHSTTERA
jgi:hypothetical protein